MVFFPFSEGVRADSLIQFIFRETLDRGKERGKIVSTDEEEDADAAFAVFTVLQSG